MTRNSGKFIQGCPSCGRRLSVRHDLAGKKLACQHCHAEFMADDPRRGSRAREDWRTALMRRADELLTMMAAPSDYAWSAGQVQPARRSRPGSRAN